MALRPVTSTPLIFATVVTGPAAFADIDSFLATPEMLAPILVFWLPETATISALRYAHFLGQMGWP